jgi:hypothetical protein
MSAAFMLIALLSLASRKEREEVSRATKSEEVVLTEESAELEESVDSDEDDLGFQEAHDDESNPIFKDFRPDKQRLGYKSGIIELK